MERNSLSLGRGGVEAVGDEVSFVKKLYVYPKVFTVRFLLQLELINYTVTLPNHVSNLYLTDQK